MGGKERTASERVGRLATRQHGVVSYRQLRTVGFSEKVIKAEVGRGRLRQLHRRVYAVGHEALSWEGWCVAAVAANAPCVASHWSAAWVWGLTRSRPSGRFHVTATTRRHRKREFHVHFAALAAEDTTERDGIPVTSIARTVLDLAGLDGTRTAKDLRRCEELGLLDLREFEALLARTAGHKGHSALAEAVELYKPDSAVTRSDVERDFRELVRGAGLPEPALNYVVGGYEIDCWWEEARLAVEIDTYGTHGSRLSFEEDRKRGRVLGLLGVRLERVTDRQLAAEPAEVLRAVEALLGASYSAPS
jgi:very-short-patch-repair endonuclease